MTVRGRSYDAILKSAAELGLSHDTLNPLANWLSSGQIDQKRLDAQEMLEAMREHLIQGVSPLQVSYQFAHTFAWENARQRAKAGH